jgi:diaminohydroxyphosphoribosylaminopyrimidine deaminase/5-amino-6-(5-phosphoribosylamino)uracil reductase
VNTQDEKFMQSAVKLAEKGISSVEPNPAVGCVVVKAGQLIGKGYHKKFGGPHAEVNALADCRTLGVTPEGGTMYVTLEHAATRARPVRARKRLSMPKLPAWPRRLTHPARQRQGPGATAAGRNRSRGRPLRAGGPRLNAPFFKLVTTGKAWVVL